MCSAGKIKEGNFEHLFKNTSDFFAHFFQLKGQRKPPTRGCKIIYHGIVAISC